MPQLPISQDLASLSLIEPNFLTKENNINIPVTGVKRRMAFLALLLLTGQDITAIVLNRQNVAVLNRQDVSDSASPMQSNCTVSAWVEPGHAFVEFNCGSVKETLGFYPSAVKNDSSSLLDCRLLRTPCKTVSLNLNHTMFMNAYQEAKTIQESLIEFKTQKFQKNKKDDIKNLHWTITNNCIDFMRRIMDKTGVTNWKSRITYTYTPAFYDKIFAIAWHYFNLT